MFTGGRGGSEALVADCVSGVPAPHALGAAMGELARTLPHEHASEHATLEAVTAAAVRAVPGAEHASISLVVRGKTVESRAATDPLAERIDARQTDRAQHTLNPPAGATLKGGGYRSMCGRVTNHAVRSTNTICRRCDCSVGVDVGEECG